VVVVAPATAVAGAAATTPAIRVTPVPYQRISGHEHMAGPVSPILGKLPPTSVRGRKYSERTARVHDPTRQELTMPEESHPPVQLAGSERAPLAGAAPAGQLDTYQRAELTLVLRRRAELPDAILGGPTFLTREQLAERYGADPADVDLVLRTLAGLGIEIIAVDPPSRRIRVAGLLGQLAGAFGTELRQVSSPAPTGPGTVTHRYREGPLFVPASLDGVVLAVLGLDTRPLASPHFRVRDAAAAPGQTYTPDQVAGIYQFPAGTTGAGQTIAVIELGGGYSDSDLATYFGGLGIAVPSVTAVGVDGGSNAPGSDPNGADIEVALDIEVIGAAAPGAAQVVYFAPNTDSGFVDAISEAAQATPAPIAISISWGQSEDSWTAQSRDAMDSAMADAAALGITVCVASGDNGSDDAVSDGQPHVDFPASSPHALGCGGTKLLADPATGVISSEVVWNETAANEGAGGGGVSDQYDLPSWQADAGVPPRAGGSPGSGSPGGRGVPDVAGNADPATGYQIYSGGQAQVVGGTSAVAPLWSALIGRLAEATGQQFGLVQTLLYAGVAPGVSVAGLRDITSGDNGAYKAGPGWDACSGLGSPDGTALLNRLQG
jgi:kumamolisin